MPKFILITMLLCAGCVDQTEQDPPEPPQPQSTYCGRVPDLPGVAPEFPTVGDATVAAYSLEEYDRLQYFFGIYALWSSCLQDGGLAMDPPQGLQ